MRRSRSTGSRSGAADTTVNKSPAWISWRATSVLVSRFKLRPSSVSPEKPLAWNGSAAAGTSWPPSDSTWICWRIRAPTAVSNSPSTRSRASPREPKPAAVELGQGRDPPVRRCVGVHAEQLDVAPVGQARADVDERADQGRVTAPAAAGLVERLGLGAGEPGADDSGEQCHGCRRGDHGRHHASTESADSTARPGAIDRAGCAARSRR